MRSLFPKHSAHLPAPVCVGLSRTLADVLLPDLTHFQISRTLYISEFHEPYTFPNFTNLTHIRISRTYTFLNSTNLTNFRIFTAGASHLGSFFRRREIVSHLASGTVISSFLSFPHYCEGSLFLLLAISISSHFLNFFGLCLARYLFLFSYLSLALSLFSLSVSPFPPPPPKCFTPNNCRARKLNLANSSSLPPPRPPPSSFFGRPRSLCCSNGDIFRFISGKVDDDRLA